MIYWYDEAIVAKFREITGDERISVLPPEVLFSYVAQLKDDKINLPLVALSRGPWEILHTGRTPESSDGLPIGRSDDGKVVDSLQFIPVVLNYQLDVIARKRNDCDLLTSELIFYLVNNPTLRVNIKKGANVSHKFSIFFNGQVEDNSDIESHMSRGEYFRNTLVFNVPDAKLWKTTLQKHTYSIGPLRFTATTDMDDLSKSYIDQEINLKIEGDNNG